MRRKVVALLLSLFALWAFAAYVTVGDGLNLLSATLIAQDIGRPTDAVVQALQAERHGSLQFVGGGSPQSADALPGLRAATDAAIAQFERRSHSGAVRFASLPDLDEHLDRLRQQLANLPQLRATVDRRSVNLADGMEQFDDVIDNAFMVRRSLSTWMDPESGSRERALVSLAQAREMLAREDALLSGILEMGYTSQVETSLFGQFVGAQRQFGAAALSDMRGEARDRLDQLLNGIDFERLGALEIVIMNLPVNQPLVSPESWRGSTDTVLDSLREIEVAASDEAAAAARLTVAGVIVQFVLAGLLGLAAVIASVVISVSTARDLIRQLQRLRNAADELATRRLPGVVERLQRGEQVDVTQEAPPLEFGDDEIGQVGQAFNSVQQTAVRVAVEQAELRRSVRDVFLSLARRSQTLLHRQLGLLDAMERRATGSEELAELFRVDHLSTRMRRNAENLIVLSGAAPGRAWRRPVPMLDILRAALAEVEEYTRINVGQVTPASVHGRAAADVIHLLAELLENAASFSPPETVVGVRGAVAGRGYAVEIVDQGLGMSARELELANDQLRDPPEFKLTGAARLGLFVVGRLARRHGIRAWLRGSPGGGTTAIVLLPPELVVSIDPDGSGSGVTPPPSAVTSLPPAAAGGSPALAAGDRAPATGERFIGRHRVDRSVEVPVPAPAPSPPSLPVRPGLGSLRPAPLAPPTALAAELPPRRHAPSAQSVPPAPSQSVPPASAQSVPPASAQSVPPAPALSPSGLPMRPRPGTPSQAGSPGAASTSGSSTLAAGSPEHGSPTGSAAGSPDVAAPQPRGFESMRRLMASYRDGTLRGRRDAASLADANESPQPPANEEE